MPEETKCLMLHQMVDLRTLEERKGYLLDKAVPAVGKI